MTAIGVSAVAAGGGPAPAARILASETGKGLHLMWRRRGLLITGVIAGAITYVMIRFLIGGGHITRSMVAVTLPALLAWAMAGGGALAGSGGIAEEVNGGTLEQAHLSPARPTLLVLGRLDAVGTEQLIRAAVLGVAFWLGYRPHYVVRPEVLVPLLLIIGDALAYVLVMTALTLRFASIGAIVHVFGMVIMFFNGMLVPVSVFPHGAEIFTRFVPTTLGVEVLNTSLAGQGLGAAWSDGTLPWLLIHVAVTAGLGWVIYIYTVRRARREGGLGPR
jgi:ABC-2 type transport system permease protein